jgi:hypothetical protein
MPRLRDRSVLDAGIIDMPMIWQTDAFALAAGYDETTGRYAGLWTPDDPNPAPATSDSLLLVRPDIAQKQRAAEPAPSLSTSSGPTVSPDPVSPRGPVAHPGSPALNLPGVTMPTRFYGVKTLNPAKIALDFKNIADEVIAHLREATSTDLKVRIEIEATDAEGFSEGKIRTVSENARTLKFDQSGFEET